MLAAGCPDRAARFLARLDRRLATLRDDAARRGFLDRQLAGWEHRYARFLASEGASEPRIDPADPPQASDFLITITGIAARRGALGSGQKHGCGLEPRGSPKPAMADLRT
jgi:hypothetical protein